MGKFKEIATDPDSFEQLDLFEPPPPLTERELSDLQRQIALGVAIEMTAALLERQDRLKYYKEAVTVDDLTHLLEIAADMERILE